MSLELTEHQLNTIKVIAQNEGIHFYTLNVKFATSEGDGYSGTFLSITLKGEQSSLHLILKETESTENESLQIFRSKSYVREIYVYNNVLRNFAMFQKENNILHGFNGFARIYGSSDIENNEYLILEDLKQNGYTMWNRKIPMNVEHVAAVFSEYGKFHAVSLAMKEKQPDRYIALAEHLGDFYSSSLPRDDAALTIRYKLQIGFEAVKDDPEATKSFKKFVKVAEKFLLQDVDTLENQLVVTHSDCWCNNIMFKYKNPEDLQKPDKVCFVDWQLSKMGSPVLDLAYFFFACTAGETLHDYKKYLKIYHTAVSELLLKFSCDAEKLFPYTLLEYHWSKFAKYGLYTALMTINLTLLDTYDGSRCTEFRNSEKCNAVETKDGRINIKQRNERIVDIINCMAQNDLI